MTAIWSIPVAVEMNVILFTLGITLFCAVIESAKRGHIRRHWPLKGAVAALLLLFYFQPFICPQFARAAVPVGCMVLMAAQWIAYRKSVQGTHFAFLSFVAAGFVLANLWLALISAWLYSHNGDLSTIQILFVRTNGPLTWMIGALGAVVSVWGLFTFVHWVGERVTATGR